jgi:acyl-CoA thioesterase
MSNYTLEDAQEYFKKDRFATDAGVKLVALSEEESEAEMVLTDAHKNAYGGVMGGAIFTLADFAFATLTNNNHKLTVAQQVSINYLSAPKGDKLSATAHFVKDGKSTCVVEVMVKDNTGREVALFTDVGFKL